MRLAGKTALVTGANRGIGLELCRQLVGEGANILAAIRTESDEARAAFGASGIEVSIVLMDTSDPHSVQNALNRITVPVDILINNAAVLDRDSIFSLQDEEIEKIIRTNLIGPMLLARHFAEGMKQRHWGRIVNVSSGMGAISRGLGSDSVVYRVSKLAINGFTICLAEAMRGTGVLVNSVDPGWVRTAMGGPMAHRTPEQGAKSILQAVLLPDRGPSGSFFRDGHKVEW